MGPHPSHSPATFHRYMEKRITMVSMVVRGSTGDGCLYAIESLAMWSVTPLPPTADDLLCGPFYSILSAINASVTDPRISLDSVVLLNDDGGAIAQAIRDDTARAVR